MMWHQVMFWVANIQLNRSLRFNRLTADFSGVIREPPHCRGICIDMAAGVGIPDDGCDLMPTSSLMGLRGFWVIRWAKWCCDHCPPRQPKIKTSSRQPARPVFCIHSAWHRQLEHRPSTIPLGQVSCPCHPTALPQAPNSGVDPSAAGGGAPRFNPATENLHYLLAESFEVPFASNKRILEASSSMKVEVCLTDISTVVPIDFSPQISAAMMFAYAGCAASPRHSPRHQRLAPRLL